VVSKENILIKFPIQYHVGRQRVNDAVYWSKRLAVTSFKTRLVSSFGWHEYTDSYITFSSSLRAPGRHDVKRQSNFVDYVRHTMLDWVCQHGYTSQHKHTTLSYLKVMTSSKNIILYAIDRLGLLYGLPTQIFSKQSLTNWRVETLHDQIVVSSKSYFIV